MLVPHVFVGNEEFALANIYNVFLDLKYCEMQEERYLTLGLVGHEDW